MKVIGLVSFSSLLVCCLSAGQTTNQLHVLRRDIGKNLIKLREVPGARQTVYCLLDQVGSIDRLARAAVQKKKKIKRVYQEEHELLVLSRSENEKLKSEITLLEERLKSTQSSAIENSARVDALQKEKSELTQKAQELENKEKALRKVIESSIGKPSESSSSGSSSRIKLSAHKHNIVNEAKRKVSKAT